MTRAEEDLPTKSHDEAIAQMVSALVSGAGTTKMDKMKQWKDPEGEQGCADLGVEWGSGHVHGCLHFGLSPLQQAQEAYARRLRKAIIMHGKYGYETAEEVLRSVEQDLGQESLATVVRIGNSHGKTALHMAAWRGNIAEIDMLLRHGAALDTLTVRGHSPLIFAIGKQRDEAVQHLVSLGARTRIVTKHNISLLEFAAKCRLQDETMDMLRVRESSDNRQCIDFAELPKSCRRSAMAFTGTLIFLPCHCDPGRLDEEEEEGAQEEEVAAVTDLDQVATSLLEDNPHHVASLLLRLADRALATVKEEPQKLQAELAAIFLAAARAAGLRPVLQALVQVVAVVGGGQGGRQGKGSKQGRNLLASALPRALRLSSEEGAPVEWSKAVREEGVVAIVGQLSGATDTDLGMAVARELVGEGREEGEVEDAAARALLERVLHAKGAAACVKVARLLGKESDLGQLGVWSTLFAEGKLQALEEVGDRVAGVRGEILALLAGAEAWKVAAKLGRRWGRAEVRVEERAALEEMLSKGRWSMAVEYAAEDPELTDFVRKRAPDAAERAAGGERSWDVPCLELPKHVLITWVGDQAGVEGLRERLGQLPAGAVVGIDTEWRHPRPSSLLQIGSEREVALVDMVRAEEEAGMGGAVEELLGWLLCEAALVKAVFSFREDLARLEAIAPSLASPRVVYHDLALLHSPLHSAAPRKGGKGLAALAERVLGLPLDKTQQCSNWDRRPLLEPQVRYAALDAWVLLRVYEALHAEPAGSWNPGRGEGRLALAEGDRRECEAAEAD